MEGHKSEPSFGEAKTAPNRAAHLCVCVRKVVAVVVVVA